MSERKYLPTIGELIDTRSIKLMKSVFIEREVYRVEMNLIMDDIISAIEEYFLRCRGAYFDWPRFIHALQVNMLANHFIWKNEGDIRTTPMTEGVQEGYKDIAQRLIATHSINGVRTRAKNEINRIFGERIDGKIDCLAADLPPHLGNWRVFDD